MIRFVCTCGHRLEVDDDQAGTSLQCPACGLLTDVPTLSELRSFTEDGTYRLDAERGPIVDDHRRLDELGLIYSKKKHDDDGVEIDLRTLPGGRPLHDDKYLDDDLELAPREFEVTSRPKYDPETGELIKPLEVRRDAERDVDPSTIPVAKAALSYATRDLHKSISPLKIGLALFLPMNVVVMSFVFLAHAFFSVATLAAGILFFLWPALICLIGLIFSHYGNVVDDTGRNEQDDLPRPLRNLEFYDDIWAPFVAMFGGFLVAFAIPILVLLTIAQKTGLPPWIMASIGGVIGAIISPAVLLTTNLSGSTFNLRPDRVLKVIRICGVHYLAVALLGAVAWPIYFYGAVGICIAMLSEFFGSGPGVTWAWVLVTPALLIGIYLGHYYCWYLGLLYKAHQPEFPWVLQRFVKDPMDRRRGTHADKLSKRPLGGHLPPPTPPRTSEHSGSLK